MQLIYLWLDMKSSGIENLALQLSTQHLCVFDYKQKELKIEYETSEINVFSKVYPTITNVSAIVGENGCGKTTILKEMFDLLRYDSSNSLYLAVYFDGNTDDGIYYWHSNIENKVEGDKFNIICHDNYECLPLNKEQIEDEFFIVRYTEVLSLSEYAKRDTIKTRNSCDLSMAYRSIAMRKNNIINKEQYDPLLELYHGETECQIQAISNKSIPFFIQKIVIIPCKEIDVNFLENVTMRVEQKKIDKIQTYKRVPIKERARDLCKELIYDINSWDDVDKFDVVVRTIIYTYLRKQIIAYNIRSDEQPGHGILAAINREINATVSYWLENINNLREGKIINEIESFFCKSFSSVGLPGTPHAFCENMQKFVNILLQNKGVSYDKDDNRFYIDLNIIKYNELMEIYQYYKKSIGQYGEAFSFEFGMSSGERAFINLLSYVNYAQNLMKDTDNICIVRENGKKSSANRSVIFLIDELDALLHPRWQQIAIRRVLDNISRIFKGHNVQIIFTTHSPILLSDIPATNVTYLEKDKGRTILVDKKEQSFAENIYCLYRNGFFLQKNKDDNSPWIMGDFAYFVIKDICKTLKEIDDNITEDGKDMIETEQKLDYIEKVIDLIGNTVIKKLLQNKFKKTYEKFLKVKNGDKVDYRMEIVKKYLMKMTVKERESIGTFIKTVDGV